MNNEKFPKTEKQEALSEPIQQEKLVGEENKLLKETDVQRIKDLEDTLKRLQADFDNFRKQNERERQDLLKLGSTVFILKLLPIVDELEHALNEAKKHDAKEHAGLETTYKNFMKVLEGESVREMKCIGESFDPYKHEAVKQEESDLPSGKIVSVLKKGYYINDRVLRHAIVIVSAGKKIEHKNGEKNGK